MGIALAAALVSAGTVGVGPIGVGAGLAAVAVLGGTGAGCYVKEKVQVAKQAEATAEKCTNIAAEAERRAAEAAQAEEEQRHARVEAETLAAEAIEAKEEQQRARAEAERRAAEAARAAQEERRARDVAVTRAAKAVQAEEKERLTRKETQRELDKERALRELGIQPDYEVSEEDIRRARRMAGWVDGCTHIVVTGNRGVGKSTLINSFRGLKSGELGSAPVGETETTLTRRKYIDQRHPKFIWYDVPGAGTEKITAWNYYFKQRLFMYDKVVLVHESTVTEADLRILKVCKYRNQECILVRSKADQHIRNCRRRRGITIDEARIDYIDQVRADADKAKSRSGTVESLNADLFDHIVSDMGVLQVIKGKTSEDDPYGGVVDEVKLLRKLGLDVNSGEQLYY